MCQPCRAFSGLRQPCSRACHTSSISLGPCDYKEPGNGSPSSCRCVVDWRKAHLPSPFSFGLLVQGPVCQRQCWSTPQTQSGPGGLGGCTWPVCSRTCHAPGKLEATYWTQEQAVTCTRDKSRHRVECNIWRNHPAYDNPSQNSVSQIFCNPQHRQWHPGRCWAGDKSCTPSAWLGCPGISACPAGSPWPDWWRSCGLTWPQCTPSVASQTSPWRRCVGQSSRWLPAWDNPLEQVILVETGVF